MLVSEFPPSLYLLSAFVLGALWGSFFNVAIHRWPRDMSVVSPGSHCPACGKPIPGWRNVPIFSYLTQRGKAACCGATMSPRYLVVEVLSAILAVALAQRFIVEAPHDASAAMAAVDAALWFVFVGGLVIATFVDLEWMEIPDEVSIGGAAVGLVTVSLRSGITAEDAVLGAGAGYLVVQIFLVWGWQRMFGMRGMGEGDPKLLMMIGAFLGWRGVAFALVAGSMQGVIAYVFARAAGRGGPKEPPAASETESESEVESEVESKSESETELPSRAKQLWRARWRSRARWQVKKRARAAEAREDTSAHIPFGPFLALGALEFLFFGEQLVRWYLGFFE